MLYEITHSIDHFTDGFKQFILHTVQFDLLLAILAIPQLGRLGIRFDVVLLDDSNELMCSD